VLQTERPVLKHWKVIKDYQRNIINWPALSNYFIIFIY